MPKSKRQKLMHLTQVQKKGREHKDKLFENVRAAVPEYQRCFVFSLENSRNTHLKVVRQELTDCKYVFFLQKFPRAATHSAHRTTHNTRTRTQPLQPREEEEG